MLKHLIAAGAGLALASCGSGAPTGNAAAPAETQAASGGFNALDACATLPREKVAEIAGAKVESATLSRVTPGTAGTAAFSQCSYAFAGGATLDFFARQSPVDDNTPDAIQRTKQGMIDNLGAKPVDIAGLGTAAFSVEQMHQLHVFWNGNRYLYFMSMNPPAGRPVAEVERALAKAVTG